ncbi:hypothetical protein [Scytonema sp. PCC 10023]|uniref:hypothetical protein n=1 Tax=Scytonema sp. PCC 10023 TaxID=1680591 RepID=UPI0039C73CC3
MLSVCHVKAIALEIGGSYYFPADAVRSQSIFLSFYWFLDSVLLKILPDIIVIASSSTKEGRSRFAFHPQRQGFLKFSTLAETLYSTTTPLI